VLDKKRLRVVFTAVGGIFVTIVPVLLAMHNGVTRPYIAAPVYGRMDNSTRIFAFSIVGRNYDDSAAFSESLWMEVASVHSQAEDEAIVHLMDRKSKAWLGGRQCKAETSSDKPESSVWRWADGTPYDYYTTGKYDIRDGMDQYNLYTEWQSDISEIEWSPPQGGELERRALPRLQDQAEQPAQ